MQLFCLGIILALALRGTNSVKSRTLYWDDFRVRYGTDFRKTYERFPKTEMEAQVSGFVPFGAQDCSPRYCFQGRRYMSPKYGDAIILIFDIKGYIAGVQNRITYTEINHYPSQKLAPYFVKEGNYYVSTVYFINPSRICSTGRTAADFQREGTGDAFYFQLGPNPFTDLDYIPKNESQFHNPRWNRIGCLPLMGYHYGGYELREDVDCETMSQLLPIYEKHVLVAFDWAFLTYYPNPFYEFVIPAKAYAELIGPKPRCLLALGDQNITTLHVYMISDPHFIDCDE